MQRIYSRRPTVITTTPSEQKREESERSTNFPDLRFEFSLHSVRLDCPRHLDDQLSRVLGVLAAGEFTLDDRTCFITSISIQSEETRSIPSTTTSGSRRRNIVCFQCVGVPCAPVVKKTSPPVNPDFPVVAEASRPSTVKKVSK